ncbi:MULTISPECIES: aminoglycoside phosphotransferase family protein [unclassified Parafrankia]|uniref:aminoglycoside phosphotransferase family protein n=1 Tax=unclassified Parafrankia TaxID=2994368 RepID=UPI000DA5BE57|nr:MULTISPECIES: aminoglycoside phosphotransferase family protein [unclassified Parafrankia]TCJ35015.1 aminoglycoside phosphotransferase family protein [Parafrankia sp. BMG5.11]SQD97307.1 Aminoglycoside phosphotransferase [Parafrankia sp. Ea1.12]
MSESDRKMHASEVVVDTSLVGRLIAAQFPEWAGLPLEPVRSAGTDNAIYRLGVDLAVRLPRIPAAAGQVDKEHRWLPQLAPLLPLDIPVPLGTGTPGEGYPWPWSVHRWLEGEDLLAEPAVDLHRMAIELGNFVAALQQVDPTGGPPPGTHNFFRGAPLARRDAATRAAIHSLRATLDTAAATAAWDTAVHAPRWQGTPVWIHGDLLPGNLLTRGGRLHAVIDFGGLGVGDPACDVMAAWTLLSTESREAFRSTIGADDATWARGRGWALSFGLIALPYYQDSNPTLAHIARHTIDEAITDPSRPPPTGTAPTPAKPGPTTPRASTVDDQELPRYRHIT